MLRWHQKQEVVSICFHCADGVTSAGSGRFGPISVCDDRFDSSDGLQVRDSYVGFIGSVGSATKT